MDNKVIALRVEINGIRGLVTDQASLKAAIKASNAELSKADLGSAKYRRLERRTEALKNTQKQLRSQARVTSREIIKGADGARKSYRGMNAELVNLRNKYKELSSAERRAKIGRDIVKNIKALDGELKRIDARIGNFQRNVGNYKQALISIGDVVTGGLITGGIQNLASSVTQTIKESLNTIKDFEKQVSELGSITGLRGSELSALAREAIDISKNFGTSATQIVAGFSLVGSAKPELLESAEALAEVTKQVDILSKAAAIDFERSASVLPTLLNQFGQGADQAAFFADVLATSQQRGTARIEQLAEAFKNSGSALRAVNIDFQQGNVLLQALAKGGLLGAEAGTKLRNIITILAKTNREELNPSTQDFNDILNILSREVTDITSAVAVFGRENATAALTLIDQRKTVDELSNSLAKTGAAYDQASNNTDNLSGLLDKLNTSWDSLIISVNEGDGALSNFAKNAVNDFTSMTEALRLWNDGVITSFGEFFKATTGSVGSRKAFVEDLERLRDFSSRGSLRGLGGLGDQDINAQIATKQQLVTSLKDSLNDLTEGTEDYKLTEQDIKQVLDDINKLKATQAEANKEATKTTKSTTKAIKEEKKAIEEILAEGSIAKLDKEIKSLTDEIRKLPAEEGEKLIPKIVGTQAELDAILERMEQLKGAASFTPDFNLSTVDLPATSPEFEQTDEAKLKQNLSLIDLREQQEIQSARAVFDEKKKLEEELKKISINADIARITQRLELEELSALERTKLENEIQEKRIKLESQSAKEIKEIRNQIFTAIENIAGQVSQLAQQRDQNRINAIEREYDRRIELAEGNAEAIETLEMEKQEAILQAQESAFERKKNLDIAEALINGAVAVTKALATLGPIAGPIAATAIGVQTALQVALIEGQEFTAAEGLMVTRGGSARLGSEIKGPSHSGGGVDMLVHGRRVNAEGGEFIDKDEFGGIAIVNKKSSRAFRPVLRAVAGRAFSGKRALLADINSHSGWGTSFAQAGALVTPSLEGSGIISVEVATKFDDEQLAVLSNIIGQTVAQQIGPAVEAAMLKVEKAKADEETRNRNLGLSA